MRLRVVRLFLALLFAALLPLKAQTLVIQHSTIIDLASPKPLKNASLVVQQGRILAVGDNIKPPAGAILIDGRGKFLIPGLWDMHVHLGLPDAFFPMLVANGITGVREMFTGIPLPLIQQWRARSDVPRIVAPGFIDGPSMLSAPSIPPGAFAVMTPEQGRVAVHLIAQSGYDFIKVYNSIPRDAYFAIAQEARALGIRFEGHVPEAISPLEAAEAGQHSQEHLINILLACSTNEESLRSQRLREMYLDDITPEARLRIIGFPEPRGLLDTYSEAKAADLFGTFVRTGTWQTPTLALVHGFAYGDELNKDPRLKYMPENWRKTANPRDEPYMRDMPPAEFDAFVMRVRALLQRYKQLVLDMHKAGVMFLAGTDISLNNPVLPGVGLHEELALLVESGFTPLEALETATKNPAMYFGVTNQLGTLEVGKVADIVMLDANPLADIRNTQKVRAVVMRGRYFSRADLDGMLERAAGTPAAQ